MRNLFLFLTLTIHCLVYSQQYVPLPLQNCFWQMTDQTSCYNQNAVPPLASSAISYKLYPSGNIIINQITYVAISKTVTSNYYNPDCPHYSSTANGYVCALRQDTANRMVYIRYSGDTIDKVLYNFNYVKGDSVKTFLGAISTGGVYQHVRVIDSVFYHTYNDGISRKTFRLIGKNIAQINQHNFIIEGIGNDEGLLNTNDSRGYMSPGYGNTENWSCILSINNFTVAKTPTNTYYSTVSITEHNEKSNISVFPNPITDVLNIKSPQFNTETSYYDISDVTGRSMLKGLLYQNSNEIDFSTLATGIYFVSVNINKRVTNYKIIKQ